MGGGITNSIGFDIQRQKTGLSAGVARQFLQMRRQDEKAALRKLAADSAANS